MNKKIFGLALFAMTLLGSTGASAAITYGNSVSDPNDVQSANAIAAPGGGSVRANNIVLTTSADSDIPVKSTSAGTSGDLVIRLPEGLNFDGAPAFKVTPGTPTAHIGLTLKDSAGDPTLTDAGVTLSDANGDGGMDRALISVARASKSSTSFGDTLTISINVKVDAGVKAGVKKASVIIDGNVATVDVVDVVSNFIEPIYHNFTPTITAGATTLNTSPTTSFTLTIPKGTVGGTTMTLTAGSKIFFSQAGITSSTITASMLTPNSYNVFAAMTQTAADFTTRTLTFTVTGTSTFTLPEDMQVSLNLNNFFMTPTTTVTGLQGLTLAGAVSGKVNYIDIRKGGSTAALATGAKPVDIVVGSKSSQTLPSISITESFDRDAVSASTQTITITPGTGIKLETATISITGTGWAAVNAAATATISATTNVMTIGISNATGGSLTVTIGALKATASALGSLTLTVGKPGTDMPTAPKDVLTVARGVSVGTVSSALRKGTTAAPQVIKTGPGSGGTSYIEMKESTYGALTTKEKTGTKNAVFSVTPSSNATISSVTVAAAGYPGVAPTFSSATCSKDTPTSETYVCTLTGESDSVTVGTSTVTATVVWAASSTAAVGSDVVLTLDGNVGATGTFKVGEVGQTTKAAVTGAIPDVKPGSLTAADLATVTITELFTGAVTNTVGSSFRVLAPAGVAFQDAAAIQASSTTVGTATISSTFRPNDTLTLARVGTATITFKAKAIFSSDVPGGLLSFDIVDGDINGKSLSNISAATLNLAYVDGTLEKLSAGKAAAVNVGFSVSNTVEGGLAPYTVASSANTIATPTISGSIVSVEGVAAGAATITVTDALGATSTYDVTVSAGAVEPAQGKATKASDGSTSAATFTGGATTDGGTTYTDAITTADEVIINATINVDPEDVGEAGGIHAVVLSPAGFLMLESDGSWVPWDGKLTSIATYLEVEALAASYSVPLYSGTIAAAGKWRFAVIYSTDAGKLVYTTKAAMITVSE